MGTSPQAHKEAQKARVRAALAEKPHAYEKAGFYTPFLEEVVYAQVAEVLHEMLGEPLIKLIKHAQTKLDEPDHEIHQDVAEAMSGHIQGRWKVKRYDAPVEWYAAQLPEVKNHLGYTQQQIEDMGWQKLPGKLREQALYAMSRDKKSYHTTEWDETFDNLFTTQGVSTLWHQAANDGAANTGASAPAVKAWFNNAQAVMGVGDSTTAAANTQFDLQAATNKLWVAMDATFPTLPATTVNQIVFRATYGSSQANFAWNEFAIANDGGSNVTIPGSTARSASNGTMLDRVVSAQGTKASGQSWQPSMTLSIS